MTLSLIRLISLSAIAFCLPLSQASSQEIKSKPSNLQHVAELKGFTPVATDFYNRKAETFWYKGSSRFRTERLFHGYTEVNYAILRFSSRQAMTNWDARFARIRIRGGWRAGDVFKNAKPMKPNVVSDFPGSYGLIALHLDFSVGNTVILVGGNQHKSQARDGMSNMSPGISDAQLTRAVQAVAQELKRQASSPNAAKPSL